MKGGADMSKSETQWREHIINDFIDSGFEGKDCRGVLETLLCYSMPSADAKRIAEELSADDRNLANIVDIPIEQLVARFGLDEATALFINNIPDLIFAYRNKSKKQVLYNVGKACEYFKETLASARVETLVACFLDNGLRIVNCEIINVGNIDSVGVKPMKIIQAAGRARGKFAFIAHNHPVSGADPSEADIAVTSSVKQILAHIGVRLLDHIIVSGSGETYSMKRAGHLPLLEPNN